ncbi:MAG: GNAT family N-acetyltransferase [Planctomycetota bacterium]
MDLLAVEIVTDRLRLRAVAPEDVSAIYAAFTARITRYMQPSPPAAPSDTEEFVRTSRARMHAGEELVCAVLDRDSGEFLGCCGLHEMQSPAPELGIWIAEEAQGAGRGREAVRAMHAWGSAHCAEAGFFRYPVDRANAPSRRVAEALGGEIASSSRQPAPDGRTLDLVEYHIPAVAS